MPSEQDNPADQTAAETPQSEEVAGDIAAASVSDVVAAPADEETTPMPGDAASEPVSPETLQAPLATLLPAAETLQASPLSLLPVADPLTEQPDGAVGPIDDDDAALDAALPDDPAGVGLDVPTLEALLFSTHHPLTGGRLAELLDVPSTKPVRKGIRLLNESYQQTGRCFRIEQVAGGFQMLTLADYGPAVQVLHQREADSRLTKAALETMAIIAYKQPILRADVEAIRGVASGETIRSLMEKHLVKIAGRAELPGRPILYGTTKRFLEVFGLNSLRDLPQAENLPKVASRPAPPTLFVEPATEQAAPNESVTTLPPATPSADPGDQTVAVDLDEGDDQAVNNTVQLTQQAAQREVAQDAVPDTSETVDDAEPAEPVDDAEPAEPVELADDADDGDEPRPE